MDSFKVILLPDALKFYKQCLPSLDRVIYEVNKENKKVGVLLISSRPSAYRRI